MKVGIIGFGKMGMFHGALLKKLPGVELTSIADTTKLVLKAFKSVMPDIKYYVSYKEMINKNKLDAVIITTPSFNHVPIASYAAERNIHFFVEKPLSSDLHQAEELYRIVKKNNVKSMVGFSARYLSPFMKGFEIIKSGELGKIISVNAENYLSDVMGKEKGWRFNKALSGGGVVIDYTVHIIDLLFWYFGYAKEISAKTKKIYSESVEDEVTATIAFNNDIKANLSSSWSNPNYRKSYLKLEITGEKGTVVITDQTVIMKTKGGIVIDMVSPDLYQGYYLDIGGSNFSIQMQKFYNYIVNDVPVEADIESGLAVQKIIDAIYTASESGRTVKIQAGV